QAEDGIRGKLVTGVQTCALPIWARANLFTKVSGDCAGPGRMNSSSPRGARHASESTHRALHRRRESVALQQANAGVRCREDAARSEERRVGKESGDR